jgi:hypothetical protein
MIYRSIALSAIKPNHLISLTYLKKE